MKVKEIFYSIQGEGWNSGRPAVFCRFSGCNLWSGREQDRQNAICKFYDTDFLDGASYAEDDLVLAIEDKFIRSISTHVPVGRPLVILTGGEPGLQITKTFIEKLRKKNFSVSVETNGTVLLPDGVYQITVSPKFGADLIQVKGTELKVVWPQPFDLNELGKLDFRHFCLQPMDGCEGATEKTVKAVLDNPKWRLSLQTHKILGLR